MAKYTHEAGAQWPEHLIDLTHYKDADNTVGSTIAQIKELQEAGDFDGAQAIIDAQGSNLKQYVFDSAAINKYVEELRNLQIYTKARKQQIFYNDNYEEVDAYVENQDVWLGPNEAGQTVVGRGNANPYEVLSGVTFSSTVGENLTGTMIDNGAVNEVLAPGQTYRVPIGYHNGEGIITASGSSSGGEFHYPTIIQNGNYNDIDISNKSTLFLTVAVPTVKDKNITVAAGTNNISLQTLFGLTPKVFVSVCGKTTLNGTTEAYSCAMKNSSGNWVYFRKWGSSSTQGITSVSGSDVKIEVSKATELKLYAY